MALDQILAELCKAASKASSEELPAELVQAKQAGEARAKATARAAELLRVMSKTETPEIFEARPASAAAGAGR